MDQWGHQIHNAYKSQIDNCIKEMEILREASDDDSITRFLSLSEKMNNLIAQGELKRDLKSIG